MVICVALGMMFGITRASGGMFFFENPLLGKSAPDFTLATLTSDKVNLTKYREGQPTILFFWATWCPHCREQLVELKNGRLDEIEKKGIKMVFVDVGEDSKTVRHHMQRLGLQKFDVFIDEDSKVSEDYGLIGVPTFYFVDKNGVIQDVEHEVPDNFMELFKPMHDDEQPNAAPAK